MPVTLTSQPLIRILPSPPTHRHFEDPLFLSIKHKLLVQRHVRLSKQWAILLLSHQTSTPDFHALDEWFFTACLDLWRVMYPLYRRELPELCSDFVEPGRRVQFIHYEMIMGVWDVEDRSLSLYPARRERCAFNIVFGRRFVRRRERDAADVRRLRAMHHGREQNYMYAIRERRWAEEVESWVSIWEEWVRRRWMSEMVLRRWVGELNASQPRFS